METLPNPQQQQRLAKLNLLNLDDDQEKNQDIQCSFEHEQWGRSVQTQTFLREKLSQRYKLKRKSQRQSRIKPLFRERLQEKSKLTDKQSLKEILRKLDSKQMGTPREQDIRKRMLSQNHRFSKEKEVQEKYISHRTTIDHQSYEDRSYRKALCQSVNKGENNFVSKKMEVFSVKKIGKTQDESCISIQGPFIEMNAQNFGRKRQFFTDCKHTRRFKNRIRKNTQNKENQVVQFADNPTELLRGVDDLKKRLFTGNTRNVNNLIQSDEINKRTFHILQEINRTKSINLGKSMNFGKKFEGDSLKLKKSQLMPYSKVLKQKSNCMSKQKRSDSKVLMHHGKDNIWVKLQIRG